MGYLAGGPIAQVNRTVTPGAAVADGQIYIPIPGGFQPGMTDVYVGGAMLVEGDYDDSDGMQIVLARGMAAGTAYRVVSYNSFAQIQPVGGQLDTYRNLLMNADGRVNVRNYVSGTSTTGANQYTLDRWRVVTSGQNLAYTLTSNGYTMTAPAGGAEQVIEGTNIVGGSYCLNWQGTATATVNGTAVAKRGVIALPANTNATVRFIGGTFYQPQFEYGLVATRYEQRFFNAEQTLCQRFAATALFGSVGRADSASTINWMLTFPVRMRAIPGLAVVKPAHLIAQFGVAQQTSAGSSFTSSTAGLSQYLAQLNGYAGLTVGNICGMVTDDVILATAEL